MTLYVSAFNLITSVGILQGGFLDGGGGVRRIDDDVRIMMAVVRGITRGVQRITGHVRRKNALVRGIV